MADKPTLDDALALMRDLRARCDWDRAQTHESLRPYLIEEAHELDDALRRGNRADTREELGDVLLQVLFHSVIAEERGAFDVQRCRRVADHEDARAASASVRRRREAAVGRDEGVEARVDCGRTSRRASNAASRVPAAGARGWRRLRLGRHGRAREKGRGGARGGSRRARASRQTIGPAGAARAQAHLEDELGDLLFACINLCRRAGVHPALALDRATDKFARRFEAVEALARERGIVVADAGITTLDALWNEVKLAE